MKQSKIFQLKKEVLQKITSYSYKNRKYLKQFNTCGCYYCEQVFIPEMIKKWIDEGETALCPFCEIDSIINKSCGFEINEDLLKKLRQFSFENN